MLKLLKTKLLRFASALLLLEAATGASITCWFPLMSAKTARVRRSFEVVLLTAEA